MNSLDEKYDQMLHDEFGSGRAEAEAKPERPAGLARYRTAALVGAGGLACATVGALLGGLGGHFTRSPAGAHSVTSSSQDLPLATAVNSAYHAQGVAASAAGSVANSATGAAAAFSEAAGPLAQGLAPVTKPTADLPTTAPTTSGISTGGNGSGGSGSGGSGSGGPSQGSNGGSGSGSGGTIVQATGILELGLTNSLANLTGALSNLGTLSADPAGTVTGLVPPLEGVVSDVT
ncbi:MAG TPA: hypothetical protein VIX84_10655, partial [Acidimicrobiales bacterium]